MPELLAKCQLKRLIREVIKEAEEGTPDFPSYSQKADEIIKFLLARGAKNNRRFKKFADDLKYKAKLADLGIIHSELEPIMTALRAGERATPSARDKYIDVHSDDVTGSEEDFPKPPIPYGPEDWKRWSDAEREEKKAKYKTFKKRKLP
jgi:hypothetical protein